MTTIATTVAAHTPPSRLATTIAAAAPTLTSRNRYASASLRRGFCTALEDVHRRVDHDPHHVDEVPVDPRDLHSVVGVGRVVAPERADGREEEQRQPDEDVRAVEAGQREEDRAEGAVVRREADPGVLADLREQE